jgi:hypothetical protein
MRFLIIAACIIIATSAECLPNKVGRYFCYVTKSAGAGKSFAGSVKLPDDQQKFVISIEPKKRWNFEIDTCKELSTKLLDSLTSDQSYSTANEGEKIDRDSIGAHCFANERLILKHAGSEREVEFFSITPDFYFIKWGFSLEGFVIYDDNSFKRTLSGIEVEGAEIQVIEVGQCEPIP